MTFDKLCKSFNIEISYYMNGEKGFYIEINGLDVTYYKYSKEIHIENVLLGVVGPQQAHNIIKCLQENLK